MAQSPEPLDLQNGAKANILLVDDNPANLLSLRSLLDSLNQNLVEVRSGHEAIQKVRSDDFAVVLLDVLMPGMGGFEAAQAIRANERSRHTPIIFVTASDIGRQELEQGYALGAVDFLVKPLLSVAVRGKVRGFVELFQEKQRAKQEAEQLRLLVHSTTEYAIFMLEPSGNIATWNPGAERLKGYKANEIIGQHFSKFYPQEAVDRCWPEHELTVATAEGRFEDEGWRVRKDGSQFWANVIITALKNDHGELLGFSKITRDLSERKKAEESARRLIEESTARRVAEENSRLIQEQRERLHVTLASIGDAVISTDAQGRVEFLNPVAQQLIGWKSEEAAGRALADVFHIVNEATRQPVENPALRALKEGVIVGLANHTVLIAKDGAERPIDDSAAPIRNSEGHVIGCVLVFRDITERKKNEERLRDQQEWLRVTLASIGDAVIATDTEGRVTFLNGVAEKLTGWRQTDAQGRLLEEVFEIINEQTQRPVENPVEKVLRSGSIVGLGNHTVLIAKDGTRSPIDDAAAPIRDEAGKLIGVVLTFRDVTEQRQAEHEIRQSEARKSAILETALDCIITMDHEGKVVEFNPAAERTFGYRREQIIGRELGDVIIPAAWRQKHRDGMNRYLATGDGPVLGKRIELPALRADGSEFPVELSITRISSNGAPLFTAYLRDISEQKWTDQYRNVRLAVTSTLAEASNLEDGASGVLAAVCDNLGWDIGFVWTVDERTDALVCRKSWHKTGLTTTEFEKNSCQRTFAKGEGLPGRVWSTGKTMWILDVVNDPNFPRAAPAASEGLHSAIGCPLIVGEQTIGVVEFFTHRLREPDPDLLEIIGTVGGSLGQFIERTAAEKRRLESEEKLRLLANTIPQLAWMARSDGHIFWYNRRWYEYTGTTPEQMEGWGWQSVHDPDVLPEVLERWKRSLATGETFDMVFPLRAADGHFHPFLTRVNPLKDGDDHILYWFGTNTDISDIKRMEEALRDADRRKDEFLATLAHELRNPLAPIRNSLQILKMPRVDEEMAQQTRDMMERQVHHLVRLVDDLLDVSRVMRGKIELRREPIELAAIVARALETAKPLIEVQGHNLELSVAGESLLLDADPVRLVQVLGNLLTNAAKYTEANGHIRLTARREGEQAVVKIRDNGIGIAPDMLPHVFELFVQADHATSKAQGGLGIGLTLVKSLVEMHGGSVAAHSAGLGRGSEFTVRLPLVQPLSKAATAASGEPDQAVPKPGHRLLLVDDNHDAALTLSMLLRLQGHDVRVAHNGKSALEVAASFRPAMIFLDIGMPGMDGYEVARRIRTTPGLEHVVLAALTGWGQVEDRRRTEEAGFDHHLVKPPEPKVIDDLLAQLKPTTPQLDS